MGQNGSSPPLAKETYRIGEVAQLTQLEPYVLRYWETEFPLLHPQKSPYGQRLYRRADIETVLTIKQLLYEEGFTIAGARRQLEAPRPAEPGATPAPTPAVRQGGNGSLDPDARRELLRTVRAELAGLLTLLSRR